jgi:hypothetical protein
MTLAAIESALIANESAYGAMLDARRAGSLTAEEAADIAADLHAEEAHLNDLRFDATDDAPVTTANVPQGLTSGTDEEIAAEVLADIRLWSPRVAGVVACWVARNNLTLCHVDITRFSYEASWIHRFAGDNAHIEATTPDGDVLVMKVQQVQKGHPGWFWLRSICDAPGMSRAVTLERLTLAGIQRSAGWARGGRLG